LIIFILVATSILYFIVIVLVFKFKVLYLVVLGAFKVQYCILQYSWLGTEFQQVNTKGGSLICVKNVYVAIIESPQSFVRLTHRLSSLHSYKFSVPDAFSNTVKTVWFLMNYVRNCCRLLLYSSVYSWEMFAHWWRIQTANFYQMQLCTQITMKVFLIIYTCTLVLLYVLIVLLVEKMVYSYLWRC